MAEHAITVDLSAPVRLNDVPELGSELLRWWGGELFAVLPSWAKAWIPKPHQPAVLFARNGVWRIVAGADDAQSIDLDASGTDSSIAEQILRLAPDFALTRLTVVLPRDSVLIRRVELPLMPDASVRQAVELQVDRLSPFKAGSARVSARVVARHVIEGKLEADVAFAPRIRVEQLEARLAGLGLKPIAVDVESANGGPAGFDLRAARRQTGDRRSYLIQAGIAAGAILAWLLASYAWSAAREGELESWRQRVAELKPVAERTAGLRRQVEGMAQPFEIARTHAPAQTLSVLAELTTLLPDDAQLTELRMTGPTIELTGLAVNAPALIAKLEASKRFGQVKFRAPVRTVPATGKNRFEISLVLEGGGAR